MLQKQTVPEISMVWSPQFFFLKLHVQRIGELVCSYCSYARAQMPRTSFCGQYGRKKHPCLVSTGFKVLV